MYRFILVLLLIFTFNAAFAEEVIKARGATHCAITKALTINELVDSSGIIFKGKLKSISSANDNNLNFRKLKFKVSEPLRGLDSKAKEITINEWASLKTPFNEDFDKSKTHVFFFYKPSKRGLSSLTGMEQGLVEVKRKGKLKYASRLKLGDLKLRLASTADSNDLSNYDGLKKYVTK